MPVELNDVIYDYLVSEPEITALVDDRIFPGQAPEGVAFPYIVWHRIDARRDRGYEPFEEFEAFVFARVQFDCWGEEYDDATDVGTALLAALSGYGGDMSGTLVTAHPVNEFEDHDSIIKRFRKVLDFEISYQDSVKT